MAPIKLLKLSGQNVEGVTRLQSQLYVGNGTADFILKDGVLKCWGHKSPGGFDFHPYSGTYEIVESIEDMRVQKL